METKWGKMVVLSFLFHLVIFSAVFFVPQASPTRRIQGPVYEVDLVELPASALNVKQEPKGKAVQASTAPKKKKKTQAKRITSLPKKKKKEKPVVIAKRTVKDEKPKSPEPEVSATKRIEEAVSKLKREMVEEDKRREAKTEEYIAKAISRLEQKMGAPDAGGGPGGVPGGIPFRMYLLRVETLIKGNWSYPVALSDPESQKDLEAVVMLKVNHDGTIMDMKFQRRSSNPVFDQSVEKAIDRSDPLPEFPEGYRKTSEEFEVNFNLKDLEQY